MGPTCSIIYENEPMEPGTMHRPPRKMGSTFLSMRQLMISIIQGLMITAACLGVGYYFIQQGNNDDVTRTVIFITLLFSNIFLTLANRSFKYSILKTITYKNNLVLLITGITLGFIVLFLYTPFARDLFKLSPLSLTSIGVCAMVGMFGTLWIEIWKFLKRKSGG
jgi:Ca2+-transporting ATPase